MSAKIVFLFALVALVAASPASQSNLESSADVAAVYKVPASVSEYFDQLYKDSPTDIVLEDEAAGVKEEARRVRRAPRRRVCRHVMVRKNGKNYPQWQCV